MADREEKGALLVRLARRAIEHELGIGTLMRPAGMSWLDENGATFVTIQKGGDLRGCIGSIDPVRPLYDDITRNAKAAAFHDPRFNPLRHEELEMVDLEVSLLSPIIPMAVASEEELISRLEPHVHGLVIRLAHHQATFLPSVWETLPTPLEFVRELKRKGGIPPTHWSEDVEVFVYTVDKFAE